MITVATFYHFTDFADFRDWQTPLKDCMLAHGVRGTILLAPEGLNATLAGPGEGVEAVLELLRKDPRFSGMDSHPSKCEARSVGG
jgi:UPF0176 protein